MLLDAVKAELFRFSRNASAWIWALFVIPLGTAITGIFYRQFLYGKLSEAAEKLPANVSLSAKSPLVLGQLVTDQSLHLAGIGVLTFFLIAAAVISASDYRWESWRLLRPRNSRRSLILGKAIAIAIVAIIPLLLYLFSEVMGRIISASMENRPIQIGFDMKQTGITLVLIFWSWLRTIQVGVLALLAGIATRSLFGAYVIPVAFGAGTYMVERMMIGFGWGPTEWRTLLLFPSGAYEALQTFAIGTENGMTFIKALVGLTIWIALPVVLAVLIFDRQNLSRE